jgi:hypothetical protein
MITISVLQFLFLIIAILFMTVWLVTKMFLLACTHNQTTLEQILTLVWKKNPQVLSRAMDQVLLTQVQVGPISPTILRDAEHAFIKFEAERGQDFTDDNCHRCGQPVPWSRLAPGSTESRLTPGSTESSKLPALADQFCQMAPPGWWCSRKAGHEGPCAARPCS